MSTAATKRRVGVISTVVVALVASLLVWLATRSDGEIVRKADLNDGGIWVTNSEQARYGRINKPAGQLDAGVLSDGSTGSGLDIFQDGAAIVGYSKASNQIVPINPAEGTLAPEQSIVVPKPSTATGNRVFTAPLVDVRGGTIAMIDPAKGELRAQRVDDRSGITGLDALQTQAKPLAKVGGNSAVAVGVDGTVYAVSAEVGTVTVLRPEGNAFAKPVTTKLGFTSKSAQVTAVGSHWAVWDSATGKLYSDALAEPEQLSVGNAEPGNPAFAALQQPGPDAASVLIQDETQLTQVSLTGDSPTTGGVKLSQGAPGQRLFLSAPVRLASCIHAAWAGASNVYYGRNCGAPTDADTVDLGAMKKGVRTDGVKLRVNRGLIVLNDLDSGDVWDIDRNRVKIDNWNSVIPPPQTDDKNKKKDENLVDDEVSRTPPKAQPDNLQVRPGRTSTLHVLDNDSDSQGSILAISPGDVSQPGATGISTSASADGQTVQVTVPEEASGSFSFDYTVNNGTTAKNGRATAKVNVRIVGADVNTAPKLRSGQAKLAQAKYPVVASGSVRVGVIADWRDAENDPIQVSALDPATTGVDGSGALTVKAQGDKGDQVVDYQVDDGRGGTQKASVTLDVLSEQDSKAVPPKTQPDVLRAVVGKPVQLQPLGNDIAGADPTDPQARMRLAQAVKGPGQLTLDTNLDTNVLTVTGQTPGTSTVTYAAQVGSGVSVGRIRVDIMPNPSVDLPPVATPDAAVLRGQTPVIADVLSNDYSPRSDVLVVQRVVTGDAWLRVSVVQGRWIRAEATAPLDGDTPRRGTVSYTISDGTKTAVGQLSVVQKPEPKDKVLPTVVDDVATVRVGDAVTIPALDNDSMSEGIPLKLDPASVKVLSGGGQAFASGTVVRYVPDQETLKGPKSAILEYATYPEGLRARAVTGRINVTINPLPDAVKYPNQPPSARSFSASVTAGDTLAITVPTSGVDPDGDLTFVSGIVGEDGKAVDLKLGRVLGFGAATIRYEAYPRSAGTEVIRYQLRDRFGLTSEGFVRVGVVQPGDPQPPVAVEDDIVAAPGRTVRADVLSNDLIAAGDSVSFVDLSTLNDADVLKDFQKQKDDTFKVVAPDDGPAKVLTYGITDGLFDPSKSTLTVRGQKDFNNPPIAVDDTGLAKQGETSILVDALANDRDLDGEQASLKITKFIGDGVVREGRKLRIQLRPQARVVPYVIEDADGASAMALIYVPAGTNGAPYVVDGKTIKMGADSTVDVSLADYVVDPRGGKIALTSPDTVSTSPDEDLQSAVSSGTELKLTSTNGYVGPAALMLEVTNATGPADKAAQTTYVTIPVQIGPDVPVLRCPDHEVRLVADGPARTFDIPRLCHAWLPTGMDANNAQYEATWDPAIDRVDLNQAGAGGRQVVLRAQPAAQEGSTGAVTVKAKGGAESYKIKVRVVSAPPAATLRPVRIEGLIAGTSRTVNLSQYLDSPLTAPKCQVQSARVISGTGVSVTQNGCQITVSASDKGRGDARITVQAVDAPGRPAALGQVSVSVRSKPDPMAAPTAVADRILGSSARVDFRPPAYDGGLPIQGFEVTAIGPGGGTKACSSSPCTITGLTNGQDYSFTVRSRNPVGWSDQSPRSNTVRPDTKPKATSITDITPGDRKLTVRWSEPPNEGSKVLKYRVQWVNIGGSAGATGQAEVPAPGLTKVISGLINNDAYNVRVQANNEAGWGPFGAQVKAQSFGKPAAVPAPTLSPREPVPGETNAQVSIAWAATDPNGPPITKYDVFRRTGGGAWNLIATRSGGDSRVASDTIPYEGQTVQYVVTATNGGPATSDKANFSSYTANGYPDTPTLLTATTPREDKTIDITYRIGSPHAAGYDRIHWTTDGVTGSFPCSGTSCPTAGTTRPLDTTSRTIAIRACNSAGYCSPMSNAIRVHPYGPTNAIRNPGENHDNNSITFTWNAPVNNGRPITQYQVTGDKSETFGASRESTTIGGLGYSDTRTIRVRAFATDSGWGPYTSITGTTNAAPKPKVNSVYKGSGCGATGCLKPDGTQCGSNCNHIGYNLSNYNGAISCSVDSSDGGWSNPDNGTGGSHEPSNGGNDSNKFFGFPNGWVRVTCSSSNGSDSAIRNPWG
ncbi:fibronectin type III domain-containing protein [Terrabacter sp. LjRoot27]|uniref:Ig-like domain-containing protein n=1 Tax=Terrabacter sp. LjRoot27 TaxID=3342306 RepID=UPI003ED0FB17